MEEKFLTNCKECGELLPPPKKFATHQHFCSRKCSNKNKRRKFGNEYNNVSKWKFAKILDHDGSYATYKTFNRLLEEQNGTCALCEATHNQGRGLYLDHDHVTGIVRGLLCHKHNLALGILGDSKDGVQKALDYLNK